MNNQEKKALEVFVIVLASFYSMLETEEAKEEFIKILLRMKLKAEGDKFVL